MTGQRFGLKQDWWYDGRRDVLESTDAALDYFEYLHGFFDGDWLLAIAAYNAGEGTVGRAVRANRRAGEPTDFWHLDLPRQTEHYVPRLLALRAIVREPAAHGIALPSLPVEEALAVVEAPGQVDLAVAAEMADLSLETLYRYHAGLNRWATPPDGPHRIAVPADRAARLRAAIAEREQPMVRWQRHAVAGGETLSGIAEAYDTNVPALQRANDLRGSFLRVGQNLIVPTASRGDAAYALSLENRRENARSNGPAGRHRVDYRVRSGDTFWTIARRHDVSVERLAAWNDMAPGDPIHPGQRLAVWVEARRGGRGGPGERMQRVEYTVRTGDSLYAIARRFNVGVDAIRRWNQLQHGAVLQPGQRLELRVDVTEQASAG
jgi:membrane-bound lytic murein transglycosylase D